MDLLLLLLALGSLPVGAVVVLVAVVLAVARAPRHRTAVLPALAGAGSTVGWVVVTCRSAVRADESGTSGTVFSDAGWLAAGVALGVVSLVLGARHRLDAVRG
ncbi:hypothetical protein AB2L27_16855 [Kineococcus sp. LSe6-4]|uniref:Integral membrane protein n=1 Tax=Kineococcus halophytocola TaxID=3234027 RepID=A0ABV4H577_9ACTN